MMKSIFLTSALAAFEFPEGGEIMEHFPVALQQMKAEEAAMPVQVPRVPAVFEADAPSAQCKKCVIATAKEVLDIYVASVKKWCAKPSKCDKKKKLCKFLSDHEKALEGALIYYDKPFLVAYSYCIGAQECKDPTDGDVPEVIEGMQFVEEMSGMSDAITQVNASIQGDDHKCRCEVTKKVFDGECKWWEKKCQNPPAKLQKLCDWIHKEPEMAQGYLAAATSPWTFAAGWCAAKNTEELIYA